MRFRQCYLALIFTFLLGAHEGFVALWKIPEPQPRIVFPYRVASLPPADAARLEEGIRVDTRQELMHLLEDYLS